MIIFGECTVLGFLETRTYVVSSATTLRSFLETYLSVSSCWIVVILPSSKDCLIKVDDFANCFLFCYAM